MNSTYIKFMLKFYFLYKVSTGNEFVEKTRTVYATAGAAD